MSLFWLLKMPCTISSLSHFCVCSAAAALAKKLNVECPIIDGIFRVIHDNAEPLEVSSCTSSSDWHVAWYMHSLALHLPVSACQCIHHRPELVVMVGNSYVLCLPLDDVSHTPLLGSACASMGMRQLYPLLQLTICTVYH